jgi:hypothetical protein
MIRELFTERTSHLQDVTGLPHLVLLMAKEELPVSCSIFIQSMIHH